MYANKVANKVMDTSQIVVKQFLDDNYFFYYAKKEVNLHGRYDCGG